MYKEVKYMGELIAVLIGLFVAHGIPYLIDKKQTEIKLKNGEYIREMRNHLPYFV